MTIDFNKNITEQLLKNRTMRLPDELLSGKIFEFTIKDKGDFEAFDSFLKGRYCDAELIWDNRVMADPNQEDDVFPQVYNIDASALLLASYNLAEGGIGMLADYELKDSLYQIMQQAQNLNDSNSVLQNIQCCDDPDMQLEQDDDDDLSSVDRHQKIVCSQCDMKREDCCDDDDDEFFDSNDRSDPARERFSAD